MSVLVFEIRHKLPMWSLFTGVCNTAKAGYKRRWREHVENALMAESHVLGVDERRCYFWKGDKIVPSKITITQICKPGSKFYDEGNLHSLVDKLVFDNLVHLRVIENDSRKVIHNIVTFAGLRHKRPWDGVRIEIEYTAPTGMLGDAHGRAAVKR